VPLQTTISNDYKVFTPLNEGRKKRLSFPASSLKLIEGNLQIRKRGYKATIDIDGARHKVIGRSCGLPHCMCDAKLIKVHD
jgi:hypothetical protein